MENILSYEEILTMRKAGKIASLALKSLGKTIKPGISTKEIELCFDDFLKKFPSMKSAFYGYNSYPASLCISRNEEIIHGIPDRKTIIKKGDLVSIDLGIEHKGVFVDCAHTYIVGGGSTLAKELVRVGVEALRKGIKKAKVGLRVGDVSAAIQKTVEAQGFSVIRKFVGHGIGRALHCYPEVPNFGYPGEGEPLKEGMVLAIEPMISSGAFDVEVLDDGWTAKTKDNSLSSHFEHTVAITKKGPWVLTK